MTERDATPNGPDGPQQKRFPYDYEAAVERAAILNQAFLAEKSIWSTALLPLAREIERPIVLDVNNVLINNSDSPTVNPEAQQAIESLREIGTIVVVSQGRVNKVIRKRLEDAGLWHPEMILISRHNYSRDTRSMNYDVAFDAEIEYLMFMRDTTGEDFTEEDFLHAFSGLKRIAPIFMKPRVPIIDNSLVTTHKNPGMLGIKVRPFFAPGDARNDPPEEREGLSLTEAVEKVREFYATPA